MKEKLAKKTTGTKNMGGKKSLHKMNQTIKIFYYAVKANNCSYLKVRVYIYIRVYVAIYITHGIVYTATCLFSPVQLMPLEILCS